MIEIGGCKHSERVRNIRVSEEQASLHLQCIQSVRPGCLFQRLRGSKGWLLMALWVESHTLTGAVPSQNQGYLHADGLKPTVLIFVGWRRWCTKPCALLGKDSSGVDSLVTHFQLLMSPVLSFWELCVYRANLSYLNRAPSHLSLWSGQSWVGQLDPQLCKAKWFLKWGPGGRGLSTLICFKHER